MNAIELARRNPSKVHADLVKVGNGLITKGGCWLYIPTRFAAKGLAVIGSKIDIIGIFAISTDRKTYGVSSCTGMIEITPTRFEEITVNGESYYEFRFDPGTMVFPDAFVPVKKSFVYSIFSLIYDYGYRPWWFTAIDDAELLSESGMWNELTVFPDQITADIFAAHTQRALNDPKKFFRKTLKRDNDVFNRVQFIPLRAGSLNKTSTLAKLADVELKRGIRSALTTEPVRPEFLEDIYMR